MRNSLITQEAFAFSEIPAVLDAHLQDPRKRELAKALNWQSYVLFLINKGHLPGDWRAIHATGQLTAEQIRRVCETI
jgi:hypothetical protein